MDNQQVELDRLAYAVGFILGDGSLFVSSQGKTVTDLVCGDVECVERVQKALEDVFGAHGFAQTTDTRNPSVPVFGCRSVRRDVFEWFFYNTFGKTEVPKYYFSSERLVRAEVLAGLWDSDGSVSFSKNGHRMQYRAEFVNKKLGLVEAAASLLRLQGIRVGEITTMNKVGYASTYKIRPNIADFAAKGVLHCKRKALRIAQYLESSETRCIAADTSAEGIVHA